MPIYFVSGNKISGDLVEIDGDNFHHLVHVCKCRIGDIISVSDEKKIYYTRVEVITKDSIEARVIQEKEILSDKELTLIQSLPKSKKMDTIIRQVVELGVKNIIPVISERTVPRLDKDKEDKVLFRWQKIANESAQFAGLGSVPNISQIQDFKEVLVKLNKFDLVLIPWEEEKARKIKDVLDKYSSPKKIAVIIGPEGGFTNGEVAEAQKKGAISITLGKTVFRTEMAGLISAIIVKYELNWL